MTTDTQRVAATPAQRITGPPPPIATDGPPVVRAEGLGKRYDLTAVSGRASLYGRLGNLFRRRRDGGQEEGTLWALRGVSFELAAGSVMGVIGRNGSGKSTLMKILARVTVPTEGQVEIRGRVAALLQLGAGFHPELSGADNIYLSGTIMGMSRREIDAVRDQIVEFAEIGRFLDTPVKFYSSGMYVRLAFAVSAHMNADILLIDEVLSVGDAPFQEKCKVRIQELVRSGSSVLFVSHAMASVRSLCHSAMVLDAGRASFHGPTSDAIAFYEQEILQLPKKAVPGSAPTAGQAPQPLRSASS